MAICGRAASLTSRVHTLRTDEWPEGLWPAVVAYAHEHDITVSDALGVMAAAFSHPPDCRCRFCARPAPRMDEETLRLSRGEWRRD